MFFSQKNLRRKITYLWNLEKELIMLYFYLNNRSFIISTMTFGFIFTRIKDDEQETCYRLSIPDESYLGRVKTLTYFFLKIIWTTLLKHQQKVFLDSPDALVHTGSCRSVPYK